MTLKVEWRGKWFTEDSYLNPCVCISAVFEPLLLDPFILGNFAFVCYTTRRSQWLGNNQEKTLKT